MNRNKTLVLIMLLGTGLSISACANTKKQSNPSYHTKLTATKKRIHKSKRPLTRHTAHQLLKEYRNEQNILNKVNTINAQTITKLRAHPRVSYFKVKHAFKTSYRTNPKVKEKIVHPTYYNSGSYMDNLLTQVHYYDAKINKQENKPISRWAKRDVPTLNHAQRVNKVTEQKEKQSNQQLEKLCLKIYTKHGKI